MRGVLVVATGNAGKVKELQALFPELALESLADHGHIVMPPEDGASFEENARLKAEHVAHLIQRPVLADDSGLVVDALGGAPGIHSARYAEGSDMSRWQKLLNALEGVPLERRTARFVCVVALAVPGRQTRTAEGKVEGRIGLEPRGAGGFGYDPVFIVEEGPRTMAELSEAEKNERSHRGRAAAALRPELLALFP